jgi:2-C-methyl-D-erythritol 2,4-cyclodiphosphate synthase
VRGKGFGVVNLDVTVIAEEPRIRPHAEAIKANLGRVLHVPPDRIGVKATTMEGRGVVGRREGIAAQAVALLEEVE